MRRRVTILSCLVLLLGFCSPSVLFGRVIRISYTSRGLAYFPAFIAVEQGFFKDEGLDVELIQMRSNLSVIALLNRNIDYTLSFGGTLEGAVAGYPIKVLMVLSDRSPQYFVSGKQYSSAGSLKGALIGLNRMGGTNEYVINKVLEHLGLKRSDYKLVGLGDEAVRVVALINGRIAGTILSPPGPAIVRRSGGNILARVSDIMFSPQSLVATHKSLPAENPGEVRAIVKTFVRSLDFMSRPTNKPDLVKVISKTFNVASQDATESLEMVLSSFSKNGLLDLADMRLAVKDAAMRSGTKEPPDPNEIFDFNILRQVLSK